jgi:hypothetical protein
VKRFKACHVRARRVDGVADAVQEVEGLKRVASVLRSSGLVQVDEGRRTFGTHQLLQQAVGSELGWREQCQRMRQLLHARCGRFGDEPHFDVGLYGVMREVAAAAVDAVGRVKEEGEETGDAWCSGMLLRLYEVACEVFGTGAEFSDRVLAAAHGSLEDDLVRAGLDQEHDVAQLLPGVVVGGSWRVLRVVDDGGGGCSVEVEDEAGAAEGRGGDGGLVVGGKRLRAMRWRLDTLTGSAESSERMMDEIGGVYDGEADDGGRWEVGVALGSAYNRVGYICFNEEKWKESTSVLERALHMRLDTLGEQHPYTATILQGMGAAYGFMGSHDTAIMLYERALRIDKDTLGLHPETARTMQNMGARYGKNKQEKKAIELFEQALRIYERTVGRMHRDAAYAILSMSTSYFNLGELVKAEELGREAVAIREKTLGQDHDLTKEARRELLITLKAKGKGRGL